MVLTELAKEIRSGQKVTEIGIKNIKIVFTIIMNQMMAKNDYINSQEFLQLLLKNSVSSVNKNDTT